MSLTCDIRRDYAAAFDTAGECVTIIRETANATTTRYRIRGRVIDFRPEELASGIDQGSRKVYLLAEDMEKSGFPLPIVKNDMIEVRGNKLNVESVDDNSRRVAGVLMAYEIVAKGF